MQGAAFQKSPLLFQNKTNSPLNPNLSITFILILRQKWYIIYLLEGDKLRKFDISGMSCAACSARVEKAVSALEGVEVCSVNLLTNSMEVEGSASEVDIITAVTKAGYGATIAGSKKEKGNEQSNKSKVSDEIRTLKNRFLVSLLFLLALMYVAMGHNMWGFPLPSFLEKSPEVIAILQMILCIIVMVINRKFFISGFKSAINLAPNMDTLVSLGSGVSFVYSVYLTINIDEHTLHGLYFESAAMILVLITLGKMLEAIAKGKTTDALDKLTFLAPESANVIRDGKELSVPISEVRVGDMFTVRPGESVAVDGIIIEGESAIDESALTGESIPVDKAAGDSVYCATINRSGFLKCRATEVGDETMLSRIIKMVEDASSSKAPIAKLADKVSGIFVPVVIGIAVITFIIWTLLDKELGFSLTRAISVLVISCPCALGLATPVSIMVGSGVGAKNGILFKNATSLEEAGKIKVVALDKTGTITEGKPEVKSIVFEADADEDELLTLAYSLEKQSEHPLSHAIIEYCAKKDTPILPISSFRAVAGNGLEGEIDGAIVRGGNEAFISKFATLPESLKQQANILAEEGKTPMFFSKNDKVLGIIAVADTIKSDSKEAIEELKKMGIRTVMLTGDNERTARAIAKEAGVDECIAGVLPDGKERVIQDLKKYGKVAMVGDGINDAPALTAADTGIAIGSGTDIAIDSANIVLIKSNMASLPAAIKLSRATLNNIKLSLFWAFFYNALGIPLAAGVLIPLGITLTPMLGAAAMSLSSFCVVTNALRLNLVNIYKKHKVKEFKKMTRTIKIEGMMCPHCEAHVKKALEALAGVESATPSHVEKKAVVVLTSPVSDEILKSTVEAQGYKVLGIE